MALHHLKDHPYQEAVTSFLQALLSERSGGRALLVSQLLRCLKDSSLEVAAAGGSEYIVDDQGTRIARRSYLASERLQLTRALLYALSISPLLPAADVAELAEVAGLLADKAQVAGGPQDARGECLPGWGPVLLLPAGAAPWQHTPCLERCGVSRGPCPPSHDTPHTQVWSMWCCSRQPT